MSFGEQLRAARKARGVTLATAAKLLCVSVPYLSDVERGNRLPLSYSRIEHVCSVFEIEPEPLLRAAENERNVVEMSIGEARELRIRSRALALLEGRSTLQATVQGALEIARQEAKEKA